MTDPESGLLQWGAQSDEDPFATYAGSRRRTPVEEVTLPDGHVAWVVTRYEEARAALNDQRLSKDMHAALAAGPEIVDEGLPGPAFARHMLAVDPPDHTRLRRLVAGRFTHQHLTQLEPGIQRVVDDLLDGIAALGPEAEVELMESFAFPMPFTVICEMLGIPADQQSRLGDALSLLLRPLTTPDDLAAARRASEDIAAAFAEVIDGKDLDPADDLISDLVAARRAGELDRVELQSTVFNLIVAGHETTTNLVGNAALALLRDDELRSTLTRDAGRIPHAIEELIRQDGPVHHATFRFATEPVELGGVTIPSGAQVLVCLAAANRDSARFAAADTFDLDRDEGRHLGFGHGIHHCLGAGLARIEARLAITALLRRFPEMRAAEGHGELRWDRGDGIVVRGLSELWVVPGRDAG